MTVLIASGATALASADFTLAAGESTTLFITSAVSDEASPDASAKIQIKGASVYTTVGLLRYGDLAKVLTNSGPAAVTYRAFRPASGMSFAVERV